MSAFQHFLVKFFIRSLTIRLMQWYYIQAWIWDVLPLKDNSCSMNYLVATSNIEYEKRLPL